MHVTVFLVNVFGFYIFSVPPSNVFAVALLVVRPGFGSDLGWVCAEGGEGGVSESLAESPSSLVGASRHP